MLSSSYLIVVFGYFIFTYFFFFFKCYFSCIFTLLTLKDSLSLCFSLLYLVVANATLPGCGPWDMASYHHLFSYSFSVTVYRPAPPEASLKTIDYSGAAGPRYDDKGSIIPHSILGGTEEYIAMATKKGDWSQVRIWLYKLTVQLGNIF